MLDLKRLYFLTGVENKPTVFLFNDTQALEESFLEDISNILSSGEVPNLYKPEEFEEVGVFSFSFCSEQRCSSSSIHYQLYTFLLDFCMFYLKQGLSFLGSLVYACFPQELHGQFPRLGIPYVLPGFVSCVVSSAKGAFDCRCVQIQRGF